MKKSFLLLFFACAASAQLNPGWGSHITLDHQTEVGHFLTYNPLGTRFASALDSINDKLMIDATNYNDIDSPKVLPSAGSMIGRA